MTWQLISENNLSDEVRLRLINAAREIVVAEATAETSRQPITSKDDLARLLHLRVDPGAAADWTAALREKTRAQLDVSNSGDQAAEADPYNRLAVKFNDYENYVYQNPCIIPNRLSAAGTYIASPWMQSIAAVPKEGGYWILPIQKQSIKSYGHQKIGRRFLKMCDENKYFGFWNFGLAKKRHIFCRLTHQKRQIKSDISQTKISVSKI